MWDADVAIAGGGIGGAVLALALARQGLEAVVVEQARQFAPIFPLPEGKARLYLVIPDEAFARMQQMPDKGLAYLQERLSHLLPAYREAIAGIPSMAVVQRVPCFCPRARDWVAHGAALLGDAVHCVSPTRGQGMNLAIGDAAALALRNLTLSLVMRAPETGAQILGMYAGTVRPPVWYDNLFVSLAIALPGLDERVARVWGRWLGPVRRPRP